MVVSIMLFQTLVILWLGVWALEDYLNNQYVRAYVDGTVQSDGWLFGVVGMLGMLGVVMGAVMRRRSHLARSVDAARTVSKGSSPTPAPSPFVVSSSGDSVKTSEGLHPAVAALKAEMSERRSALGLIPVPADVKPSGSSGFEDQKSSAGPTLRVEQTIAGPRVSTLTPTLPQNAPVMGSRTQPVQGAPMLRVESGNLPPRPPILQQIGPPRPMPPAQQAPPVPRPTVITGIVPVQKKPTDPNEKTGSSQQDSSSQQGSSSR